MRLGRLRNRPQSDWRSSEAKSNTSIRSAIAPAKLFAGDNFVENSTGTGFVHIAPGHGLDDYNLGRQNGLPIYSPVDDDGALAYTNDLPREQQMPAEMVGKSILEKHGKSDANEAVLHELRLRKALLHQENYHHSYPLLLAQQDADHFPRDGPMVHQDRSRTISANKRCEAINQRQLGS